MERGLALLDPVSGYARADLLCSVKNGEREGGVEVELTALTLEGRAR